MLCCGLNLSAYPFKRQILWPLLLLLLFYILSPPSSMAADNGDTIVLTAEDIKAIQALKIADVLNNVPGVKAGGSSVSIHGSYNVKVFVNDRPINDPTSSHGGVNWDLVSPDNVTRIEILRGKGGLTYGRDASGGVILITTKQHRQLAGNVKVYTGNFDTRDITAGLSSSAGRFTTDISGGYETTDGYTINNDKERYQAGLKVGYIPDDGKQIDVSVDYLHDDRGLSGLPEYPTPFSRKESRNTSLGMNAEFFNITSNTHYNEGYRHNTDSSRNLDNSLRVAKFGQDFTTRFETTKKGDLACGVSATWDQADGTAFSSQEEHSASVFASQSLTLGKIDTTLTFGLRGNYHSNFDNSVNPEVKLLYKRKIWHLTGTYNRTNNTPSFYQRYNETSSTRPNPDLTMEQADNFSLALFAAPYEAVSINLSGFYNLLSDRITYVTGEDGVGQYQNFGEVYYRGGDTALNWKINTSLKTKLSYTYLEVIDRKTDLWVPAKARHNINFDLYLQPVKPLSMVVTGKYTSKVFRDKNNTKTVPEYTTVDFRTDYAFKRFSLFGEVKNIFDKTYYYVDGLLAPPQTWLVGVNWKI
jgi:iron complex outermembrane receptor protein